MVSALDRTLVIFYMVNLDDEEELKEVVEFLSYHYKNRTDVPSHEVYTTTPRINFLLISRLGKLKIILRYSRAGRFLC